jgi:hypothetical protein
LSVTYQNSFESIEKEKRKDGGEEWQYEGQINGIRKEGWR